MNEDRATDAAGWVSECPRLPDGVPAQQVNREHFAACFEDFRLEGPPADALCEMMAVCRRAHIPAALVLMPETSRFRSWYPSGMDSTIGKFLDRLDVPRIDARHWIPDDGFFDANHLHPGGAAILERKLGRALLPLLRKLKSHRAHGLPPVGLMVWGVAKPASSGYNSVIMRRIRLVIILLLAGLALTGYFALRSLGFLGTTQAARPVPKGDQEIAWINPATSGANWERFVAGIRHVARERPELIVLDQNAFPDQTAAVPEIGLQLPGVKAGSGSAGTR